MTKKEMVSTIVENLTSNINNSRSIDWVVIKNTKEKISGVYDWYVSHDRTKENSYFCYNLLVLPNL